MGGFVVSVRQAYGKFRQKQRCAGTDECGLGWTLLRLMMA
jgi:hypothetical protein